MPRAKTISIDDYVPAKDAAAILTETHGRKINPDYMCVVARCKTHHVRTQRLGDRILYHKDDLRRITLKKREEL